MEFPYKKTSKRAIYHKKENLLGTVNYYEKEKLFKYAESENEKKFIESIKKGKTDNLRQILKENVDVNTTDDDGSLPLHIAVKKGNKEVIKILINKVDVNELDDNSNTALHIVAANNSGIFNNDNEIATALIFKNANVLAVNKDGNTPLHLAVLSKKYELAKILIKEESRIYDGELDLSSKRRHEEKIRELQVLNGEIIRELQVINSLF